MEGHRRDGHWRGGHGAVYVSNMAPITLDMIRRRAEHNEGMVGNLEEIALHQQEIEKIEALGQICRHLKILYMQNNLISKLQNLHRLKELEYLNMALNNVTKIENLQRCESLQKLDLTMNFITKASLLTVHTLDACPKLDDLYLMGNPCADFGGYRAFVIGTLPQLRRLDGKDVTPSERILSKQELPRVTERLMKELRADGVDIEEASRVSDARDLGPDEDDIAEVLAMPEDERPWTAATRVAEQREFAAQRDANEESKREHNKRLFNPDGTKKQPRREGFPDLPDDLDDVKQCDEPGLTFRLDDSDDGDAVVLDCVVGKYMDTSLIDVDVQTRLVRVLVKGKMLCLVLPEEVKPDASTAQRSKVTGALVVTMPKAFRKPKRGEEKKDEYVVDGGGGVEGSKGGVGGSNPGKGADAKNAKNAKNPRSLIKELGGVSIRGIVRDAHTADIGGFTIAESVRTAAPATPAVQVQVLDSDDDEPPPL